MSFCLSVVRHTYFSFLYVFAFIRHLLFIYHKSFIYPLRDIIFHNNFVPATAAATSSGQTSWPLATPSLPLWRAAGCATRMCIGADNKDPSTDWQLEASNFVISHASKSRRWRHQQAHFSFYLSLSLSRMPLLTFSDPFCCSLLCGISMGSASL